MSATLPARLGALRRTYAPGVRFDRAGIGLAAMMLAIQLCALAVTRGYQVSPPSTEQQPPPEFGAVIVLELVVVSLLVIGVYRCWKRIPERWRSHIWTGIVGLFYGAILAIAVIAIGFVQTAVIAGGALALTYAYYKLDPSPYSWIGHNVIAFVMAVGGVLFLGIALSPAALAIFLVGTLAWDYVAVMKTSWMHEIVELSGGSLPNYFIIPDGWRIDYGAINDWLESPEELERPANLDGVIGAGDFVMPSALVLSLALREGVAAPVTGGAVLGIVVSVGVLRAAMARVDGSLPALPWVNTGAIGGYVVGAGLVAIAGETVVMLA